MKIFEFKTGIGHFKSKMSKISPDEGYSSWYSKFMREYYKFSYWFGYNSVIMRSKFRMSLNTREFLKFRYRK